MSKNKKMLSGLNELSKLVPSFDAIENDIIIELKRIKNIKDPSKPVFRNKTGKIFHLDSSDVNPILCDIGEIMTVFVIKDLDSYGFCITKLFDKSIMDFINDINKLMFDDVKELFFEECVYSALNYYKDSYYPNTTAVSLIPNLFKIDKEIGIINDSNINECNNWVKGILPILSDMFINYSNIYGTPEFTENEEVNEISERNNITTQIENIKTAITSLKKQDLDTSGLESTLNVLEENIKVKNRVELLHSKINPETEYIVLVNGRKMLVTSDENRVLTGNIGKDVKLEEVEDLFEIRSLLY